MLDIGKELQTLLSSSAIVQEVESSMETLAKSVLTAMEPIIINAIKAELTSLLGVTL